MILTIRFMKQYYYDILRDAEVMRCSGITNKGTFFAERVCEKAGEKREMDKAFREYVMNAIESGMNPGRVELG